MDPELEILLKAFPELKLQSGKGTVICSLSRHEMPGRVEVVKSYVEGRKFQKLKSEKDFNFQRLEPYIVPSRRRKRQLFCALTNRYLNRKPAEVELHLNGRRYKQAIEKYNAGQVSLFEERLGKQQREMAEGMDPKEALEMEDEGDEEEGETQEKAELYKKSSSVLVGRKRRAAVTTPTPSTAKRPPHHNHKRQTNHHIP